MPAAIIQNHPSRISGIIDILEGWFCIIAAGSTRHHLRTTGACNLDDEEIKIKSRKLSPLYFKSSLIHDVGWFITLRWIAAAGVIAFAVFLRVLANVSHFFWPCVATAGAMLICNTGYLLEYRYLKDKGQESLFRDQAFASIQIGIDWILLTVLAYYTGGIVSPFVFFYIFHIIISAILLPKVECYIQTAAVCLLVGILMILQLTDVIPYHPFIFYRDSEIIKHPLHIIMLYIFFASMLIISSFFATTLSGRIRRRNEELDELRRELETAIAKLRAQDEALLNLTHKTAHELRSPLTALESILNVVLQGYSGEVPEKMKDMLQRAKVRSKSLIKMTSELLDLAKKQKVPEKEKKQIVLNKALERTFRFFRPKARSKGLQYKISLPDEKLTVMSRKEDIQLLFSNLIENAIKYTPKGKSVRVNLSRQGNYAKVIVSDTGIGIAEESRLRIFDKFYRAPNAREVEALGTGLGLALVKKLVDSYHGTITFTSEPDTGTAFTIILPLKR